jgi:hypothetical protein
MAEVWSDGVPEAGGRRLSATAWAFVRRDRTLAVLTALSVTLQVAALGLLFWAAGWLGGSESVGRLAWTLLVIAWPVAFVLTVVNVAIAAAASAAIDRRTMTAREALAVPFRWIDQIATWSLLATVVGAVLQQLARRRPFRGPTTSWLLGPPWSVVCVLVVPMLAVEGGTATGCFARSSALARERWGEGVRGSVIGTEWLIGAGAVGGGVIGLGMETGPVVLAAALLAVAVIGAIAVSLQQVFAVALYRYAVSGEVTAGFPLADLEAPFAARRLARAA